MAALVRINIHKLYLARFKLGIRAVSSDSYNQGSAKGDVSVRAVILMIALYVSLIAWMLAGLVVLVLPRSFVVALARSWSRYYLWLCRVVGGIHVEFRGLNNIPKGPLLIAAKHQSIWETFALLSLFEDPCFILKRELAFHTFYLAGF